VDASTQTDPDNQAATIQAFQVISNRVLKFLEVGSFIQPLGNHPACKAFEHPNQEKLKVKISDKHNTIFNLKFLVLILNFE